MGKKIITIAMLGVLVFSGAAQAQTDDALPSAGITPGSSLFFLDRFFENIGTLFTFGEASKAQRYLALAEERLAETKALAEQQDGENTTKAIELYEEQLAEAKERVGRTGEIDLEEEVTNATTKHLSALDEVLERVPEQAREHVRAAKERTMTGQLEALRGIAQRDPERAAGVFAAAAEGRLQAVQAKAERGGDDEEEADEVEKALEEYGQYAAFGEEIMQIAEGLGTGETEVRTLVERATEQHLQVLEDVKSKVPLQAQDEINRALENAKRMRQLLPSDIPGRVGPDSDEQRGSAPESESTVPEQGSQFIPQDAQEQIPQQPGSNEQDEANGSAPAETPGADLKPESVGGDNENEIEVEEEAGQQGGPPAGL